MKTTSGPEDRADSVNKIYVNKLLSQRSFRLPETAGSCHSWGPAVDFITFAVKSKSHIGTFG